MPSGSCMYLWRQKGWCREMRCKNAASVDASWVSGLSVTQMGGCTDREAEM